MYKTDTGDDDDDDRDEENDKKKKKMLTKLRMICIRRILAIMSAKMKSVKRC